MFNREKFDSLLRSKLFGRELKWFSEVDSTNRYALESELSPGAVVIADSQTAGRGRSGRQWQSPAEDNLYFSIVLPPVRTEHLFPLNIISGYAAVDALRAYVPAQMKWPNDIVLNGKKLGGILLEARFSGSRPDKVVVGIGINLNTQGFSGETADVATSLRMATGASYVREEVLARVVNAFDTEFHRLRDDDLGIHLRWSSYSAFLDKQIQVHINGTRETFTEKGIAPDGCLLAMDSAGQLRTIHTGDIGYDSCS